jgi:16S rRNA (guanine527-N7)-methyltransferase
LEVLRRNDEDVASLLTPHRTEEVSTLLARYIGEIELFNSAYGLVGATDTEELAIRHVLDSLAPLGIIFRLMKEAPAVDRPQIADAGSGAGLPGIPLAAALSGFDFTLIERMGRRAGFLWNTKAALGLSNIAVEEGELEKTAPGRFHLVTFRAFKQLDTKLLKTLFKACAKDGVIAAYKGKREKIKQEMLKTAGLVWEALPYTVPFLDEERHLLVIKTPKV